MQAGTWLVFLAAVSLPLATQPSAAEEHGNRPRPGQFRSDGRSFHESHRELRGGETRHFSDHDFGGRRGFHGAHGGTGGILFFYPGPIYPYPGPYMPPPLFEAPLVPGYWYYCDDPPGYYPYVAQCRMPWQAVTPGDTAPPG